METNINSLNKFKEKLLTCCYLFSLTSENRLVDLDRVKNEYDITDENDWTKESIDYFQSREYIGLPLIMDGNLVSIGGKVPIFNTTVSDRFSFTELGKSYAKELLKNAITGVDYLDHVPASDRIVRLTDNQPALDLAIQSVVDLKDQLELGNDIGDLSLDELEVAKREVYWLEHALKQDALRFDWM